MNTTPILIDWFLKLNHRNLTDDDVCYYFMEYTAHTSAGYSEANQLIYNFKKKLERKSFPDWPYKEAAIKQLSKIYSVELNEMIDFSNSTLIPIPPSKCRANSLHDDRVLQLLQRAYEGADIREILKLNADMPSSHETNNRDVENIMSYIEVDEGLCNDIRDNIYLFDDVLVTGAHFAACKNLILNLFPDKNLFGVFIARSISEPIASEVSLGTQTLLFNI